MACFDTFFLMEEADVVKYISRKLPETFPSDAELVCKKNSDGFLNNIFRVENINTGRSVIIKQAGESVRFSADIRLSTGRNRLEYEALRLQNKYAPGFVPEVFFCDDTMCTFAMEDLSDYEIMRSALLRHETFPLFADKISTYLVGTLLFSSDLVNSHKEKKKLVQRFINPDLCEITENLVLTEPYNNCRNHNNVEPLIADLVEKELYKDSGELALAVAEIKYKFMNTPQALLHGDLHSGAIFVRQNSIKIFDSEFAFFGPMGYDIGSIIANLIFAWDNGSACGDTQFCSWCLKTICDIIDMFRDKFVKLFDKYVSDITAKTPGFCNKYIAGVIADSAAYAGALLIARSVGQGQVAEVNSIADEKKRAAAKRFNILCGKHLILNSSDFSCGADFENAILTHR